MGYAKEKEIYTPEQYASLLGIMKRITNNENINTEILRDEVPYELSVMIQQISYL